VALSVVVDGVAYSDSRPEAERTVSVASSGSCETVPVVCENVLLEPGFEGGSGSAWSESSSNGYFLITQNRPRTGDFSAWLGGIENESSLVWQSPLLDSEATSARLSYWYSIDSDEYCGYFYDEGGVRINGLTARNHRYDLCAGNATSGFVHTDFVDLLPYVGTAPDVGFFAETGYNNSSSLYIDDVVLEICVPDTSVEELFSDGFELGNTSQWSATVP
jgi:hypothetical protein